MDKITRREFIKIGAGAALVTLLPKSLLNADKTAAPVIGVAEGDNSKLVKAAVDLVGGIDKFMKAGDVVCIKPNLSFASNIDCGATTNPAIVRQMVQLCLDAGASRIIVLDHTIHEATLCVERSRIEEAIIDKKVSLVTLQQERQYTDVDVPGGKELNRIQVAKAIQNADLLINMPTAKSHSATGVSLGLKSLMGLIWDRGYLHRVNLDRAIAELGTVIKPGLTVIDATRALTTGGPGGPGKTVVLNKVVAGIDPVAVDSYTVGIAQWYKKSWTGKQVKSIRAAADLGLGEIDTANMRIKQVKV
ncbi:MAG: DUF362 domain-containing protein [candidate division WOR-3 bacterium]|nr:MAG: DUF362 domain-containing protein [candidate division WOR-3 bacterium]